jgi:23S rRNA (uracil1939-C5)-methyltransferase
MITRRRLYVISTSKHEGERGTTESNKAGPQIPFEVFPQKLIYGGAALGYHDGHPVLVPFSLPGETVEVDAVRTAKGMVHARALRLLSRSPERVEPPCPYFERCGGCQYQHVHPKSQTSSKQEILRETLRRIGRITWDGEIPTHAAHPWNYRNQAQLKVTHTVGGSHQVGFFEAESHRLVPIDACLILSPRLNMILAELRGAEWSQHLMGCSEIVMLADDRDDQAMLTLRGDITADAGELLAGNLMSRLPSVTSVAVELRNRFRVFGKPALIYTVGNCQYQISPGSFFQASRFLLPDFLTAATADPNTLQESGPGLLARSAGSSSLALDLYSGVGLLTLPLARQFSRVIAVESNPSAAADLAANAKRHALENICTLRQSAFDFLRRFAQPQPDLVVLDPPRAGVGMPTLELLAALRPKRIHYASCQPPTLARDVAFLVERGYSVDSIELFDFFPQTYHIESLVRLTPHT